MSRLDDSASVTALPAPVPPRARMPLFEFFRTLRDNMIATYPEEAYERDIVQRKILGQGRFLVTLPVATRARSSGRAPGPDYAASPPRHDDDADTANITKSTEAVHGDHCFLTWVFRSRYPFELASRESVREYRHQAVSDLNSPIGMHAHSHNRAFTLLSTPATTTSKGIV